MLRDRWQLHVDPAYYSYSSIISSLGNYPTEQYDRLPRDIENVVSSSLSYSS